MLTSSAISSGEVTSLIDWEAIDVRDIYRSSSIHEKWIRQHQTQPPHLTYLAHESWNDAMELRSLVVEWLSRFSLALFSSAQCPKVLSSLWNDISSEFHHNTTSRLSTDGNIKEDLGLATSSSSSRACSRFRTRSTTHLSLVCCSFRFLSDVFFEVFGVIKGL